MFSSQIYGRVRLNQTIIASVTTFFEKVNAICFFYFSHADLYLNGGFLSAQGYTQYPLFTNIKIRSSLHNR